MQGRVLERARILERAQVPERVQGRVVGVQEQAPARLRARLSPFLPGALLGRCPSPESLLPRGERLHRRTTTATTTRTRTAMGIMRLHKMGLAERGLRGLDRRRA